MHRALFSHAKDEWTTPVEFYAALEAELGPFDLDAAATAATTRCARWLGPGGLAPDALTAAWGMPRAVVFLNPPYSRVRAFMTKAAVEVHVRQCTVVALVPARTDTRWWHEHIWDRHRHTARAGVEIRFVRGRLRFGTATASAPFPSVVLILRPAGG